MTPKILTDTSRLIEIYHLRVLAYEKSELSHLINRSTFPNGWSDKYDELDTTIHWVIEKNGIIVASARLAVVECVSLLPNFIQPFNLPKGNRCCFWSRLVVHPDERRSNFMRLLDRCRFSYISNHLEINFVVCWVHQKRVKIIERIGFEKLGENSFYFPDNNLVKRPVFYYKNTPR
jgi:2-phosphoglycerate kinase